MENMQHLVFQNLDCDIHYWYRKGTGDKWVLFFHGAGVDHAMFEGQFALFDPDYSIIAWDARGHGLSELKNGKRFLFSDMVCDCKKLFELYGISSAVLIGQSMGGNLSQEIAYYSPKLVEKLVLIDCANNTGKLTPAEKLSIKSSRFIFACYPWKFLMRQSAEASSDTLHAREYILKSFAGLGKRIFVNVMMEMVSSCLHEDISYRFRQPVLLLCGEDDKLGNIRKSAAPWAEEDTNITLHIIEHAGHNSNQDQPEKVNELIYAFLSEAPKPRNGLQNN
jgi:pimeloyl-ACP methyl ester carboxylesterase